MREEAQNPDGEATAAKPGKLIMLAVLLGCLLVGTGAGAFMVGPRLFAAPAAGTADGEHGGDAAEGKGGHGAAPASLIMLENLVVNPANSGGTRFLLISLAFEPGKADPARITSAEPQLRDAFVTLLSRRTVGELSDLELRETIRAELLHVADSIVPGIARLYIPQFVMQ